MTFRMKVEDVFRIGGKTVFSGRLETQEKAITNALGRIEVDGNAVGEVNIDGEVFTRTPHRDLWTASAVEISRETVNEHDVWLVSA